MNYHKQTSVTVLPQQRGFKEASSALEERGIEMLSCCDWASINYQNYGGYVSSIELVEMVGRTEKWITALMDGLDKSVDKKILANVLEQCGRQCQSQSFIKKAKSLYEKSKSTDEFLDKLGKVYKHLHKEGDRVYLVYPKCYCSQVNKIPKGKLAGAYCNCSRGWAKALFEGALGRSVEVIKEKSIISGDNECRLRIVL